MKTNHSQNLKTLAMLVVAVLVAVSFAQADEPKYRNLVRKYVPAEKPAEKPGTSNLQVDAPAGLTCTVLTLVDGEEKVVDPASHRFKLGDQIRVRIHTQRDTYLHIFHEGASGGRTCLLPAPEEAPHLAKAGEVLDLPSDGYFEVSPPFGTERLAIVGADSPIRDLDRLQNLVFQKPVTHVASPSQPVSHLTASSEQVLKSAPQPAPRAPASRLVNPAGNSKVKGTR